MELFSKEESQNNTVIIMSNSQPMEVIEDVVNDDLVDTMNAILRGGLRDPGCTIHKNQEKVVKALLDGKHVLYIDGTGTGKSESYFIASKMLRMSSSSFGPIIVIEPFNTLIDDQLKRATRFGLKAAAYNSNMKEIEKGNVLSSIQKNEVDILFLTPEMIRTFTNFTRHPINVQLPQFHRTDKPIPRHKWNNVPLIVIDEIHYISQDGHDFRPSYLEIWDLINDYPWFQNALKLGMTATYSKSVENDVRRVIKFDEVVNGSCFRQNIAIRIISCHVSQAKYVWLETLICLNETRNILVFCLSRNECQDLAKYLTNHRIGGVEYYFAKRPDAPKILQQYQDGRIRVLIATFASIGAGFNKADIHDVVWMYTPSNMVSFYQGIGRAGRGDHLDCKGYLLASKPWRKDPLLEFFVIIANILKDVPNQMMPVNELIERLECKFPTLIDIQKNIHEAINHGLTRMVFFQSQNEERDFIHLVSSDHAQIKEEYLKNRSEEVSDMMNLNNNSGCSWRLVLTKLNESVSEDWTCGKCSFCSPGGDHSPEYYPEEMCYCSCLEDVPVYALGRGGDRVMLSSSAIREICHRFIPDIGDSPPEWAISFVPDASGDNAMNIASLVECLNNLSVVDFVKIDPKLSHMKMFEAKTPQDKDRVLRKYTFDASKLVGVRKLLIYDDCINSGKTVLNIVNFIRRNNRNISDICILVKTIYPCIGRTIKNIDLTVAKV